MAATIRISPSPAMVLVDLGQSTVDVTVKYRSPAPDVEPIIWERVNGGNWKRRVIDTYDGNWQKTLKPGNTYRVIMYDRADVDPNVAMYDPASPIADETVAALGKRTPTPLGQDEEMDAGGTWVAWWTNSPSVPIKAVFDIGTNPPEQTPDGVDFIPGAMRTIETGFDTRLVSWIGLAEFQPETDYWGSLLLMTEDGIWDTRTHLFITKKRKVEIFLETIHIANDGDEGHNHASFKIWVCDGDRFASSCYLPEREITDRPSPDETHMEWIGLSAECAYHVTIESQPHDPQNRRISILTRGLGEDTNPTGIAGNYNPSNGSPANPPFQEDIFEDAFLTFPVATDPDQSEELNDGSFVTTAVPLRGELEYALIGSYSVTYS